MKFLPCPQCGTLMDLIGPVGATCHQSHVTNHGTPGGYPEGTPPYAAPVQHQMPPRSQSARVAVDAPATRLILTNLANVTPQSIDWLWPKRLARGKVHLLGGHVGDGKSTLTAWLAALLSRGGSWPDGGQAPIGRTLFLLAEDGLADTLCPRLGLHNADLAMIEHLDAVREPDGSEIAFNIRRNLPQLEAEITAKGFDLLVIDPLTSFLPNSDRNAEGDVRDLLTPLVRMTDKTGVAVLAIMHPGKPTGTQRRAVQQLLGATAFGAIARLVWMIAPTSPDPAETRRVLAVVKSNLAMRPSALEWSLSEDQPIAWHGESTLNIEALLSPPTDQPRADAEGFLRETLADGPMPSEQLEHIARVAGISKATLKRAKKAAAIEAGREPGVRDGPWWCGLPSTKAAWFTAREEAHGEGAHPIEAHVSPFSPSAHGEVPTSENPSNGAKKLTSPTPEHLLGEEGGRVLGGRGVV
jgi:putative DNA primase/helicase